MDRLVPAQPARLRVLMPVVWVAGDDNTIYVSLDSQYIGQGTFKEGVDLSMATTPGVHVLEVGRQVNYLTTKPFQPWEWQTAMKSSRLKITVGSSGEWVASLSYSRIWGTFRVKIKLGL